MAHPMNSREDIPPFTLGDRLCKARKTAGFTQAELATALEVGLRTVKEAEADIRPPKRGIMLAWAMLCAVDKRWLETGAGEHHAPPPFPDRTVTSSPSGSHDGGVPLPLRYEPTWSLAVAA